jgi:hypothetical protein
VLLVYTVYSVLYSEITVSRKPFGIGHMYIYNLLLKMSDTLTSQNINISSWDTLYTNNRTFVSRKFGYQPGSGKAVIELHFLQPREAGPLKDNIMFHKNLLIIIRLNLQFLNVPAFLSGREMAL